MSSSSPADMGSVRRLGSVPLPHLLAAVLVIGLGVGIYAIKSSGSASSLSSGASVPDRATPPAADTTTGATAESRPTGDPHGLALLARVRQTYARVPAVVTTGRLGAMSVRFSAILSAGVVVAEGFAGTRGAGTTILVAPRGSATFARDPGASCWRQVPASDPQALTDIGGHFPAYPNVAVVKAPQRTDNGWLLGVVARGKSSTFAIDGKTFFVRTITLRQSGEQVTEHVHTLTSVPNLPSPQPRC